MTPPPGAVIVGGGLAGLRAAETLRRKEFDGEITLIGDEPERPYNRPPLSKEILRGAAELESCIFPSEVEATWLLGRAATGLNLSRKVVALDGGDEVAYEKLIIATGCRPRPWPQPIELDGVLMLRTIADAVALRTGALAAERVAIVGAGFLGCEVAATLRQLDVEVSLIDVIPHPMPAFGAEIGERLARMHAGHGVDLRLGATVTAFEGNGSVRAVRLADGSAIDADLVLVAIGALPNTEWLEGSGLELSAGGVLCDEHCIAVGTEDVAAAGDVAAWPHPASGGIIRVEHWTNSAEMGSKAAANLVAAPSERSPHAPVLSFWSDQYDVKINAAGSITQATSTSTVLDEPESGKLVLEGRRDGALVGAVTFNSVKDHVRHRRELAAAAA